MANDSVTIDLLGDNTGLDDSLKGATTSIGGFGGAIPVMMGTLMAGVATKIVSSLVGAFQDAFSFIKGIITDGFEAFAVQQEADQKLAAVVKATGEAAGFTAGQMGVMASALQNISTVGDETIQGAMAIIATFKNIKGDQFKDTTRLALDMAAVMGTDVKSSAMQMAKALQDPLKGLTMLTRVGVTFTDQQKELVAGFVKSGDVAGAQSVILKELEGQFGGAAEAMTKGIGAQKQWNNRLGDISESLGEALLPALEAIKPAMDGFLSVLETGVVMLASFVDSNLDAAKSVAEDFGQALEDAAPDVIAFLTVFETAFLDLGKSIDLWGAAAALTVATFINDIEHTFTVVAPAHLKWFADNWMNLFTDLANFIIQVDKNILTNIGDMMVAITGMLKGEGFDFKFTALTEGFEASFEELPKIAKRKLGDVEAELGREVMRLGSELGTSFSENLADNMEAFNKLLAAFKGEGVVEAPTLDDVIPDISTDYSGITTAKEKVAKEKNEKATKEAKQEKKNEEGATGGFEGLTALADRIAGASMEMTVGEKAIQSEFFTSHELTGAMIEEMKKFHEGKPKPKPEGDDKKDDPLEKPGDVFLKPLIEKTDAVVTLLGQMLGVLPAVGVLKN